MMNGQGKSDRPVVPAKSPNNAGQPATEGVEGRGLAKGNQPRQNALRTASLRQTLLPSPYGCRLGLRGFALSGPPVRLLPLRSGDSQPSRRWLCRWASGHRSPSSLPSKLRGFWLLPPWDCLPLNTPAFAGRTTGRADFRHPAFGQGGHAFAHGRLRVRDWSFTSPSVSSRSSSGKREVP